MRSKARDVIRDYEIAFFEKEVFYDAISIDIMIILNDIEFWINGFSKKDVSTIVSTIVM